MVLQVHLKGGQILMFVFLEIETLQKRTQLQLLYWVKKDIEQVIVVFVLVVKKKQEKMYINTGCTVKAHRDNIRAINALLISTLGQHAFIQVKSKKDSMV